MAFYQCFKTIDRTTYCSSTQFKNHDEGADWISRCIEHFQLKANDLKGKPWEADSQPDNATIWP